MKIPARPLRCLAALLFMAVMAGGCSKEAPPPRARAQAQGQLCFALINLYKALGGGWVDEAEKLAPQPGVDTGRNPPVFP